MKKALFIVAHPSLKNSRANQAILASVRGLPNLTIHHLYDEYPEFYVSVKKEQALLSEHDVVVMQHPLYWYSMPPLLKLWLDYVLEREWAYGPGGRALAGKDFLLSVTAGGSLDRSGGREVDHFPTEAFFPPYEQTARVCGMRWHAPVVLHDSGKVSEEALLQHAESVRDRVSALMMGGA